MAEIVGGNKLFAAAVSYSSAPNFNVSGDLYYLDDGDSDWVTGSSRVVDGQGKDIHAAYGGQGIAWSGLTAGNTRTTTLNLGEARGGDWFTITGLQAEASSYFRPTAVQLERSDNGADWTTVETLSGLTTRGDNTTAGWLARFDISAAGAHQYWRFTLTAGGAVLTVNSVRMHDSVYLHEAKTITASVAAHSSFPLQPIDVVESGDADYTDGKSNKLTTGARSHATIAGSNTTFSGWNQSAGALVTLTVDLEAAAAAERLILKGYYGAASVFRPVSVVVQYSDNATDWVTHYSSGTLTGGGSPGNRQWVVNVDLEGESHRYWRTTLEHGGQWLLVSTFEIWAGFNNHAMGRAYTATVPTGAANDWFGTSLLPGNSDFTATFNTLTNGERAWYDLNVFPYWTTNNNDTVTMRVDLGSPLAGDYLLLMGSTGPGGIRTPKAVLIEYSDNDSSWTTAFNKTALTVAQTAGAAWAVRADISGDGAHRYWRATITCGLNGSFLSLEQIEIWQALSSDPSSPFVGDFTGNDDDPWPISQWNQSGPNGGSTTIQGNRGQAAGNSGNAGSGGRGRGKQGNLPNQEMTGSFQLCETGEPCRGALWLQTSDDWEDLDNPTEGYGVYLPSDSDTASLVVANAGVVTTLDTATWPRDTGLKQYRFRRQSNKVRFRIWDDGDPEPSTWTLTGDDASITPGDAGAFQVAYTCPTAPSVDACALFDDITVGENNTNPDSNGGNGGRGCCNGRNRRCCRRNRATQ